MIKNFFKTQFNYFLLFAFFISFFNVKNVYATYDNSRGESYWDSDTGRCDVGEFKFNPFSYNRDINWKIDNPSCAGFIAGIGASMLAAGYLTRYLCVATNQIGIARAAAEAAGDPVPDSPFITPNVGYKLLYRSGLCGSRIGEYSALQGSAILACATVNAPLCALAQSQVALASTDMTRCCASYSSYAAIVGSGVSALAIIHSIAEKTFKEGRICGHDWSGWKKFDANGDEINANQSGKWRRGPYAKSYQDCLESIFIHNYNKCNFPNVDGVAFDEMSIKNRYFREYLYGGKEFTDNGSSACKNPDSWSSQQKISSLGYDSSNQRYYMKGAAQASNYACHRFLTSANPKADEQATKAYECCKNRSLSTICIENAGLAGSKREHQFCKYGSRCEVGGVTFETFFSKFKSEYLCAKTYTVCPYDHNLGGGTEIEEYEKDEFGNPTNKLINFCQVMKHCVKIPIVPYVRMSNLRGAFISSACKDLKGDSQNLYSFNAEILPLNSSKMFSAPIAQCFKETVQNLLLNKAGFTRCKNPDEIPNYKDVCQSGYHHIEGQYLDSDSVFFKIQSKLHFIIKLVLTVSITFYGMMILLGMGEIQKKQLLALVIKIGIVIYFALGTGWQDVLIDGVLETSSILSDIMMRVDDENVDEEKLDGCQFPRFNYRLLPSDPLRFEDKQYPPGMEYLKVWDTLDCKLAKAFGFGPDLTVPNIILTMLAGFLTGGLGIIFVVAAFMFAFFFLSLILRALHIFLLSTIALILLVFVSPITITCLLFQKTKSIFDSWLKQMIGFILQPVILFAYLGIYISIFNVVVVGDVSYRGSGLEVPKQIVCDEKTNDTSIYCIFRIANFKTFTGFEAIGIGLPVLTSMNQERLNSLIRAALLMFIFSSFMDQISMLAQKLVGGSQLKSNTPGSIDIAKKAYGVGEGIRKRGTRVMKNATRKTASNVYGGIKDIAADLGNKGKSVNDKKVAKQSDDAVESSPGASGSKFDNVNDKTGKEGGSKGFAGPDDSESGSNGGKDDGKGGGG